MNKKIVSLPGLAKRPKNKPRRKIKVCSFATGVMAKAIENNYRGPQLVNKKGKIEENSEDDADFMAELLEALQEIDWSDTSNSSLHLVKDKEKSNPHGKK